MTASNAYPTTDSPKRSIIALPRPTAGGFAFFFVAAAAMAFGTYRGELAAILWSSIIFVAEAYAYAALLLALFLRRSDIRGYSCLMNPRECKQGDRIITNAKGRARFRPPLILVRYRVPLMTEDGRQTPVVFDPERSGQTEFFAGERGAYAAAEDSLCLLDAFGFFRSDYPIPAESGPRLVVRPAPGSYSPEAPKLSGGAELRTEQSFRRTEDLTDNRRYVPGDDPRRINWKIFGHAGELFVREGEPEPPPRSRFVILIDASVDPELFGLDLGRRAVDVLAEQALGLVNSVASAGFEPRFGYNGSAILSGDARDAASAFAMPAAIAMDKALDLPNIGQADGGAIVLALPRRVGEPSALERFLRSSVHGYGTRLIFVVPDIEEPRRVSLFTRLMIRSRSEGKKTLYRLGQNDPYAIDKAASDCAATYDGRGGVNARKTEA